MTGTGGKDERTPGELMDPRVRLSQERYQSYRPGGQGGQGGQAQQGRLPSATLRRARPCGSVLHPAARYRPGIQTRTGPDTS